MTWYIKSFRNTDEVKYGGKYVGYGWFIRENNDNYEIYQFTGRCICDKCSEYNGRIIIFNTPPQEVLRLYSPFSGKCSVGGEEHSYSINKLMVATNEYINWRTPEKNK